jgi:menaquinol-cytochrome c reductase iron-sulfur subunit
MEQEQTVQQGTANKDVIIINRRSFFGVLLGIGTVGMGAILAVPVLRYVLYPLYAKSSKDVWIPIGEMNDFSDLSQPILKPLALKQVDGWREVDSSQSVYVTKGPHGNLEVLSSICPHLGCTVGWRKQQDDFFCPCHGSVFEPDGKRVSGPTPRGLDTVPHKVVDGKLLVKFEYFRENVPNQEVLS